MLISEFARRAGLSVDTVRFYVRQGLLTPEQSAKGGTNPYQIFTVAHLEAARAIRVAQALGFSLKEIAALAVDYRASTANSDHGIALLTGQLAKLHVQAIQLKNMTEFLQAKIAWLQSGKVMDEPRFSDFH